MQGTTEVLESIGSNCSDLSVIVHSTTLVTNAIIERKGAKTALLTTKGFRDILEMGREQMYDIFDLTAQLPSPLVPRYLRKEVTERVTRDGEILYSCDEEEAIRITQSLIEDEAVEAVAISLLHSYKNASTETFLKETLHRHFPELTLSLSSEVAPVIN